MCLDANVLTPHKPLGFILTTSWLRSSMQPGAIKAVLEKSLETKDYVRQEFSVTETWLCIMDMYTYKYRTTHK